LEYSQQKTGSPERLPLSAEAQEILKLQRKTAKSEKVTRETARDAVFQLHRPFTIDKVIKRWAAAAKIDKTVSMHKAKHTFAVLSLAAGVDIYTTSKLLGHKNLATTQIHAKVMDEKKKQALDMLPRL
jgi:site-specific recombinase XerD